MRKNAILIICAFLLLVGCKKDDMVYVAEVHENTPSVTVSTDYATVRGSFSYVATLKSVYVAYGKNSDYSSPKVVEADMNYEYSYHKYEYYARLNDLEPNTKYYYYCIFDSGYGSEKACYGSFSTVAAPTVTTDAVSEITISSAICGGNVVSEGNAEVTSRGVCWSTSQNPDIYDYHTTNGNGTGHFTSSITGLSKNTTYYVRAYATNRHGTSYGEQKSFTTPQYTTTPTVTTSAVSNVLQHTATCGGNVTNNGGLSVTSRGVCWSTSQNPDIYDNYTTNGTGSGTFTSNITGLKPNTTYYVRSYATNSKGTSYGEQKTFTTLSLTTPTVVTNSVTDITQTTATFSGNVTLDGGLDVTTRGMCWSTSQNPTTSGEHTTSGSGTGSFTSNIKSLTPNTTYYVRAYATNSLGTSYGEQKTFTTLSLTTPTVTTNSVTGITQTTATCGGKVTDSGGLEVTSRGVCWSTSQNPTTSNEHTTNGNGTGSFTSNITGLTPNTTYYVRAYAVNSKGTSYGEQKTFKSLQVITAPTVTINPITDITYCSAKSGGNVTSDGGASVTARGVCWSTSQNPTINNSHTTNGTGTGAFTSNMTELTPNTTYYVRAYATNNIGTNYSDQISFKTQPSIAPTVITNKPSSITQDGASCGGNVTSDGGATVTARGVCWSTSQNPTVSDSHTTDGTGTGSFTSSITGLTASTRYYVRAYATNSNGTSYGEQKEFTSEDPNVGGHVYVDLGLPSGRLWAACNVGADNPESYGSYFAWGEFLTKNDYDWDEYKWANGSYNTLTKYNTNSSYGTVDNKTVLEINDDVAHVKWGHDWRMPTVDEWQELYDNTTSEWTTVDETRGILLTSKMPGYTDKTLFLPAAGYKIGETKGGEGTDGHYWSSSLFSSYPRTAYHMFFDADNVNPQDVYDRPSGFSVRPVR
ncbi:MAG: hypothetical protein MJZ85_01580 [Bacteroidales bacterium]|nr:hypothetical protein [Bacteroidales bacterium]